MMIFNYLWLAESRGPGVGKVSFMGSSNALVEAHTRYNSLFTLIEIGAWTGNRKYSLIWNVHTGVWHGQGPGSAVFYCASPVSFTGPILMHY